MIFEKTKMKSVCLDNKCIKCCKETKMLLSEKDIERIKKLGFSYEFFVDQINGWLQLKNREGLCVFQNGKQCAIYKNRPEGCQLYPLIYDKDNNCAVLDEECPHRTKFLRTNDLRKKLLSLVSRVEVERSKRIKK